MTDNVLIDRKTCDRLFGATIMFVLWLTTYAGIFGAAQSSEAMRNAWTCRQNMGFSMLIAMAPPMWPITDEEKKSDKWILSKSKVQPTEAK